MKVKKINFKEGKYWMPLLVYVLSLFVGYFIIDTCHLEIKDTGNANLKTTDYLSLLNKDLEEKKKTEY